MRIMCGVAKIYSKEDYYEYWRFDEWWGFVSFVT